MDLPEYDDVVAAAARLAGVAHRTAVLTSSRLDQALGCEVFLKCENLQRMGAFKFRGAYNALSQLDEEQAKRGVVAYSSGNHAQAVALAARTLGMPATIIMPTDAPSVKLDATRGYGANVVLYDRYTQDREKIGQAYAERDGLALVPPYNHPHVIAGQGTAALELIEDVGWLDALFVPMGGGGLLSGTLLVARQRLGAIPVCGVEPEAGNDGQRSLREGHIVHIDTPKTIADGAQTQHMGDLTYAIVSRDVTDIYTATDHQLVDEMRALANTLKIVVEPTACLGLAALRGHAADFAGKRVGVVLSGGNVDLRDFARLVTTG